MKKRHVNKEYLYFDWLVDLLQGEWRKTVMQNFYYATEIRKCVLQLQQLITVAIQTEMTSTHAKR